VTSLVRQNFGHFGARPQYFAEFSLETRLECESFEPLISFLDFLVQKL